MRTIAIAVVVCAVLSALAGYAGYRHGWDYRGAVEAEAAAKAEREHKKLLDAERIRGDGLALALDREKQNIKETVIERIKEVPKVTVKYVEVAGEVPKIIPPAIYTVGFVRVWNDSLYANGVSKASGEPSDSSDRADQVRAAIDSPDILQNHIINAGKYAECRSQLNRLIDWHEGKAAQ